MSDGRIVGIDLGTTNSCVAVLEAGEPVVIHNREGSRTTPSMVSWTTDDSVVVGAPSKRQMVTNPARTVYGVKRLIGMRYDAPAIQLLAATLPYEVVPAKNGDAWIEVDGESRSPQEVSAHILRLIRETAEDYLGVLVREAIITVPAYFDDVQRQATKDAGAIAGLEVRCLLNEPTAAALAYGVHKQIDQKLVVFDLGGGTFDVSIVQIESGVFEVLATSGDSSLGGDDFDRAIIEMLTEELEMESGIDLHSDPVALQRLKEAAERAKVELSVSMTTDINLPFLAAGPDGPIHFQRELSRGEIESVCADLLEALEPPCRRALSEAGLEAADLDQVLLVGGMTRMPAVQSRVVRIFGKQPSKGVNPDEIVALGAAVQSGIVTGEIEEVVLLDVTPRSLGLKVAGDRMSTLIPANTTVPTREKKLFATTEDNQTFVALEIYQGEEETASTNRRLGRFILGDLPARPAGELRVEVSFSVDSNGILEVSAIERESGRAASVTVEASSGLSREEVEQLAHGAGLT
jgi:molecular chaperone DnaK